MKRHGLQRDQIPGVIKGVTAKLQAIAGDLEGAEGEVIIRIFVSEHQPDIKVTMTKG